MTLRRFSTNNRAIAAALVAGLIGFCAPSIGWPQTVSYTYDALGRITNASYPDGTCLAYAYDAAGNRTQYSSATVTGVVAPAESVSLYQDSASTFDPRIGNLTCGALTVTAVGTPAHGTASIVSGGTGITYTPNAGYLGSDSFTYQVTSGGVASPNGTITISVIAPTLPPTALNGKSRFTGRAPVQPIIVTDVTSLVSSPYGYAPTISAVTQGSLGTVTFGGNLITYTYNRQVTTETLTADSYTYTVSDGHGHTATASIALKISVSSGL